MKKLCLALLGLFPLSASAISFDYGENLFLNQAIEDDFYGAGWTVDILQSVSGDVIIAGGVVSIEQDIQQDLIVFGGQVEINGNIGDDLKIFGGEVEINGKVGDDVIGAGGNVVFTDKSEIGGSVNLSGLFTNFQGKVGENFFFRGGTLIFDGDVTGMANLNANVLQFGDNARISGDLLYTAETEQPSLAQHVTGTVTYKAPEKIEPAVEQNSNLVNAINLFAILSSIFNLFVIAGIIYAISPAILLKPAEMLIQKPAKSFVLGLEILIFTPLIIIILFALGFFIPLAFLLTALWLIVLYLSRIFVALAFGLLVYPVKNSKKNRSKILLSYALGLAIYEVLVNIPLFGFLIGLLAMVFGAGALLVAKVDFLQNLRQKKII